MNSVSYYNAENVSSVLTWLLINHAVEEAMKAVANQNASDHGLIDSNDAYVDQTPRTLTKSGGNAGILFTMPSYVGNYACSVGDADAKTGDQEQKHCNTLACKMVTSFPGNAKRDVPLPNIMAHILLFNTETGQLNSLVEGTQITAWRTAGASIVATKYLYFGRFYKNQKIPLKERPIDVAIIGCGTQGESHALGFCDTFNVRNIYLWNRTGSKALKLARKLQEIYPNVNVHVVENSADAVINADVICVGTFSPNALIDFKMLKKPAIHINTVGAGQVHYGEVAQDIYDNAKVYIDSWGSAAKELKGLKAEILAEVGEIIKTRKYPNEQGITIFQSMGMAAEDATVAHAVVEAIKKAEQVKN